MTDQPNDALAALAAEPTFLADPDAVPFSGYSQPAEPIGPAEFAAIVERAMGTLLNSPPRYHGTPRNPHIRHPQGRYCVECGADTAALAEALAEADRRKAAEHAWEISLRFLTSEERGQAEWERSVRERLDEALAHLGHGIPADWDRLPCVKYPQCVPRRERDRHA